MPAVSLKRRFPETAEALRARLETRNWTHAKAAEALGVHVRTLRYWLAGQTRPPDSAFHLLDLLPVDA